MADFKLLDGQDSKTARVITRLVSGAGLQLVNNEEVQGRGQPAALLCTGQEGGRPSPPVLSNDKTLRG